MIPIEALRIALAKEKASVAMYKRMLAKYSSVDNLIYFLLNEEEKHVTMIESRIQDLLKGG